jgi:uncharacterized protein
MSHCKLSIKSSLHAITSSSGSSIKTVVSASGHARDQRAPSASASSSAPILRSTQLSRAVLILAGLQSCSGLPDSGAAILPPATRANLARAESTTSAPPGGTAVSGLRSPAQNRASPTAAPRVRTGGPAQTRPVAKVPARTKQESLGLVSDELSGIFARVAADLHDGQPDTRMQVRLSESGGPLRTLEQIMYKPGADVGLVQADALDQWMADNPASTAKRHLRFVARLYDKAIHVVARKSITNIRQLEGLKVNVDKPGSGGELTARLLLDRLGVRATLTHFDTKDALQRLSSGEIDAAIVLAPSPTWEVLLFQDEGLHLVEVPWEPAVGGPYDPLELQSTDYPTLIAEGERIRTLSVGVVLAVYNWRKDTKGFKRLESFVDALLAHVDRKDRSKDYFAWAKVDLSRGAHGWERFETEAMSRRLKQPIPAPAAVSQQSPGKT